MQTLLCLGAGYSARAYFAHHGTRFSRIAGTTRRPTSAASDDTPPFDAIPFETGPPSQPLLEAIAAADCLLVSIPPDSQGDPVLRCCAGPMSEAPRLQSIVYLSTVGVYGDHAGAWVDETSELRTSGARSTMRLAAERGWQELSDRSGKPLAILRLAGIYGPGRNALASLRTGDARRIVKPGQVFNRIHVADIAGTIDRAFSVKASGIYNVCDDEPCPPQDVVAFAARLLGVPAPPEIGFEDAKSGMSEMARSFYEECKRVKNDKIKRELGVRLQYPSYREGLQALATALA